MVFCSQVPAPGRGEGDAWAGVERGLQAPSLLESWCSEKLC